MQTTASSAPRHIAAQLVELGCREHRIATVLEALEEQDVPLTTEMVNAMLGECVRTRDQRLVRHIERLSVSQGVPRTGRTFGLLLRSCVNVVKRMEELLDEMEASGVDGISEVAQIVLGACAQMGDTTLPDRQLRRTATWTAVTSSSPRSWRIRSAETR